MKKLFMVVLCVLLLASVFANGNKESTDSGVTTLKVGNWDTATMAYMQPLIAAFENAYPNIKVEIIDTPSADYTAKLNVQLSGGSDLDAFWIKDGDTTKGLVDKGQLADLSAFISRDGVDLAAYNGLTSYLTFNSKVYALPARSDYYVMFYNKDLFDAAGVPYPSNDMTWAEWEAMCAKLTSGSGANKVYGGHFHTWNACVQNWAVQDGKHTIMDTDYGFFKPAYEMAVRMQKAGTVMDFGMLRTGNIHYSAVFANGQVATMPMGTFYFTNIIGAISRGESNVNWGIATLPHPEGVEAGWTVGSITPFAINNASKNKEAAWAFAKFITGPEGAKIYADGFAIPGMSSDAIIESIATADGMPAGSLEALRVSNIALDRPYMDHVAEVNQMLGEQHGLIMLGESTVDEGLAEMSLLSKEIQQ